MVRGLYPRLRELFQQLSSSICRENFVTSAEKLFWSSIVSNKFLIRIDGFKGLHLPNKCIKSDEIGYLNRNGISF